MSEDVRLTEAEREALGTAVCRWWESVDEPEECPPPCASCALEAEALVPAVEAIIAARLAAADRDTALRERVEALAAEWEAVGAMLSGDRAETLADAATDLRAALDAGDQP